MRFFRNLFHRQSDPGLSELKDDRLDISRREAVEKQLPLVASLEDNLEMLRAVVGPSSDVITRRLKVGRGRIPAALIHIKGFVDTVLLERITNVLTLGLLESPVGNASRHTIFSEFRDRLAQSSDVMEVTNFDNMWTNLAQGHAAVLFDGTAKALTLNTQGFATRAVQEPASETVIRGPREGFVESIETNVSMIRRRVRTPNLWMEQFTLGDLTRTQVAIMYIKGLASEELVQEVRQRVRRIKIDGILESGYVEEFIEDNPFSVFPTIFRTERPDRVASMLLEGRVAIFTQATPFVLVVPMNFFMLTQAPDDYYEKVPIGAFLRLLRVVGFWMSVVLPGFYVAALTFHNELFPTDLLISISASKEGVPFPVLFEVLVMEMVFELLREAGIRLPRAIGPAISIVGALVLGDAAIRAGLVSPPVVIIVALTAIASFTVPTFSYGIAARLFRFVFIIFGGTFGLFGIQFAFLAVIIYLIGLRSFGYPYFAPAGPLILSDFKDVFLRTWWWSMTKRPFLEALREPVRAAGGRRPRQSIEKEEKEKR
ncbi:MAG: spore germination protein [Bacillota bacterium]